MTKILCDKDVCKSVDGKLYDAKYLPPGSEVVSKRDEPRASGEQLVSRRDVQEGLAKRLAREGVSVEQWARTYPVTADWLVSLPVRPVPISKLAEDLVAKADSPEQVRSTTALGRAYGELEELAKARMDRVLKADGSAMTFEQAFAEVCGDPAHAELLDRYTAER
jgi:hypothetical protein